MFRECLLKHSSKRVQEMITLELKQTQLLALEQL